VTGVALLNTEIMGKRLELLHKLVPGTGPIGFFVGPAGRQYTEAETRDLPSAARTLGIKVTVFNIADASDLRFGPAFRLKVSIDETSAIAPAVRVLQSSKPPRRAPQ
jgi:ABC-type uncharacterized transport system substrate-binding protein